MNTPLHDAAAAGDAGIVAMLLSAGALVESRASVRRCRAAGKRLLGAGFRDRVLRASRVPRRRLTRAAAQDDATPLHRAVAAGHLAPTNVLLRVGADANSHGEGGGTPLHVAADAGRTALVKALLDAGADALAQDSVRWQPFCLAARCDATAASVCETS